MDICSDETSGSETRCTRSPALRNGGIWKRKKIEACLDCSSDGEATGGYDDKFEKNHLTSGSAEVLNSCPQNDDWSGAATKLLPAVFVPGCAQPYRNPTGDRKIPCKLTGLQRSAEVQKGEWNRSILEVDFTNSMVFLQDKDKIVAAQPFANFKKFVVSGDDFEDNLVSVRFVSQQWQIMTQNSAEKTCLLHLLQCVAKDTSAEEALASAAPGILGLNKSVLKAGILVRKAKTQFKKDERYCVLVPGKLFVFKNPNLPGQHARYVTSLLGASVRMSQGLEFELLVPGTKTLTFLPENVEEASGWMGALERSVEIAQQLLAGGTYEQQDQVSSNVFGNMNPGVMAGMIPGPSASGSGGGFIQTTAAQSLRAYTNTQDSRVMQQRFAAGLGGAMFQQPQQDRAFAITTPFGPSAPYAGTFQSKRGQGNLQNPMGGIPQQGGTSTGMPGQAGFMGQSVAGLSNSYNQPQGSYNMENQVDSASPGSSQRPQRGRGQVQQNPSALPAESGVRMIRRATQTLREFNNDMDQFLAQPSTSGYGSAAPQTQFQGYGGAQQVQSPGYGRGNAQQQSQGYGGPQQAQVMGTPQAPGQGYGSPQQPQAQAYGRGARQTQGQAYGGLQQTQNSGYRRGAPQTQGQAYGNLQTQVPGYRRGVPQAQAQAYGGLQQAHTSGYGRGGAQGQRQGELQVQSQGHAGAQQSQQFQGYGGGASQPQAQGYGRGTSGMQAQSYGRGASQAQSRGYVGAQQGQVKRYGGGAPQMQVQQTPAYGGGGSQMQTPGYGRGAPQMQSPGYGRQQFQGLAPGMAPASNPRDWKEFTSPDGRKYYYKERTKETTWTRPY
ncbi:hypothetical protein R1flu_000142 [Riccia fluitans]|uniref:WW domain-containing protein n=1 Tax=Riccia fluitans TaxID=41844 RepID=A0ABD1Y2R6_9MARC